MLLVTKLKCNIFLFYFRGMILSFFGLKARACASVAVPVLERLVVRLSMVRKRVLYFFFFCA